MEKKTTSISSTTKQAGLIIGNTPKILILSDFPHTIKEYFTSTTCCFREIIEELFNDKKPFASETAFGKALKDNQIALWSVSQACKKGSTSIVSNDIQALLDTYPSIRLIILNGAETVTAFAGQSCNIAIWAAPSTFSYADKTTVINIWTDYLACFFLSCLKCGCFPFRTCYPAVISNTDCVCKMSTCQKEALYCSGWSEWKKFPNPLKGEYLCAPFGPGVYQLRNCKTGEFVLFGKGKNVAYRMSSLHKLGSGKRDNKEKVNYVNNNIDGIIYRTIPFGASSCTEGEGCNSKKTPCPNRGICDAIEFEKYVKKRERYLFPEK